MQFLSAYRAILPFAALVIVGGLFLYQHLTIGNLRSENAELSLRASAAESMLVAMERAAKAERAAITKTKEAQDAREQQRQDAIVAVRDAVGGGDCRVASPVRVAIDRLRETRGGRN